MNKNTTRQVAIAIATLITLVVNTLADTLPINGMGTGTISDSFKVFFVPAGYVFSIWGVIYLLLIVYTVYQALPAQRENRLLQKIGWWYVISAAANSSWIFFWHYLNFPMTLVVMLALLATLLVIYVTLETGRTKESKGFTWLVRLPFSVYLGWITVATIANVTDLLSLTTWNGFGIAPQTWAVILLGAGVAIAILMTVFRRDAAYLAVLVWAFTGIGVKFGINTLVGPAAYIAAGIVAAMFLFSLVKRPAYIENTTH